MTRTKIEDLAPMGTELSDEEIQMVMGGLSWGGGLPLYCPGAPSQKATYNDPPGVCDVLEDCYPTIGSPGSR
jgi:hypothetical protein